MYKSRNSTRYNCGPDPYVTTHRGKWIKKNEKIPEINKNIKCRKMYIPTHSRQRNVTQHGQLNYKEPASPYSHTPARRESQLSTGSEKWNTKILKSHHGARRRGKNFSADGIPYVTWSAKTVTESQLWASRTSELTESHVHVNKRNERVKNRQIRPGDETHLFSVWIQETWGWSLHRAKYHNITWIYVISENNQRCKSDGGYACCRHLVRQIRRLFRRCH